jgi:hypothetical protein
MRISGTEFVRIHRLAYSPSASANSPQCELPFFRASVDGLPDSLDAIIATGDLQGFAVASETLTGLGEAVAREIARLQRDGRLPPSDRTAIVLSGDLHAGAGEDDVLPIWRAFANVCRWVAGVAGNHDRLVPFTPRGGNAYLLNASTVTLDGIRIGGLSGIVSSADGSWNRRERDYEAALLTLTEQQCDLLVLHDGPNVAGTDLPGWPLIRRVLESATPVLLIRGHDHWPQPLAELANRTQVLNVEGRVVVLQRRLDRTA